MQLLLVEDDGTLLDSVDISNKEWQAAQSDTKLAASILRTLQAGRR